MQTETVEQWKILTYRNKEIPPLWEISNFGRIRHKKKQNILKLQNTKKGYITFQCNQSVKVGWKGFIHVAVAENFILKPNNIEATQVNHIDGNKTNNHVDNLEWVTQSQNMKHSFNLGLHSATAWEYSIVKTRKLSLETVIFIRKYFKPYDKKFGAAALGRKYGVSATTIAQAAKKNTYSEIE